MNWGHFGSDLDKIAQFIKSTAKEVGKCGCESTMEHVAARPTQGFKAVCLDNLIAVPKANT